MSTVLIPILVVLLFLAAFVLFRTAFFTAADEPVEPAPPIDVDSRMVAEHLARLIRCKTISWSEPERFDPNAFLALHKELENIYPRTHRALTREVINRYSLLYTWPGKNLDLKPILLMSHQDVVPVEAGSEKDWEHPPFAGEIADGFVWGRGTMDVKSGIIGVMEAVEWLLQDGFHPERTVYLAFGHDEELSGEEGTGKIVALLRQREVELESVLDEGRAILTGIVPGVERAVALVGVAEKGYLSLVLSADSAGGHSAAPPAQTTIGELSRAVHRLEAHPMPARLDSARLQYQALASELPASMRIAFANQWLFGGWLKRRLSGSADTNAIIRSTTAPTIIHGGVKDNILPRKASAVVNFRILPGDSVEDVVDHVSKVINDERIRLGGFDESPDGSHDGDTEPADVGGRPASRVTDPDGPVYRLMAHAIRQVFPDAVPAPALVLGATDSRFYAPICVNILRFQPIRIGPSDLGRPHGVNERLSLKNCGDMVCFYAQWIRQAAG